ncbi:MAG: BREX system P-loop protein BrxC [Alkalispirochaeta sp.]
MSTIRDLFSQPIDRRIEKVIQFQDREDERLRQEIDEYVVTDNIAGSIEHLLDVLDDGFSSGGGTEIGVWVDGFYGIGKSSMTKYLGFALDGRRMVGDTPFRDLLKNKLTSVQLQQRLSTVATRVNPAVVMIDLSTVQSAGKTGEPISAVVFRQVLRWAEYAQVTKHALLELFVEEEGRLDDFLAAVQQRNRDWHAIRDNPTVGGGIASQVASELFPDLFPTERSFSNLRIETDDEAMDQQVKRMFDLIERRTGSRNLIVILDEAGQYVAPSDDLVLNLQGLAQNFKSIGNGNAWIIATAQQTLTELLEARNTTNLFKLKDRFPISVQLKADDIETITNKRLLAKSGDGATQLHELFTQNGDKLRVNTRLEEARGYSTSFDADRFVDLYPFLPQYFHLLMNVIARLARSTGGTGLRSAIKVVQETLVGAAAQEGAFSSRSVGALVTVVDFFDVLRHDIEGAATFKHVVDAVDKTIQRFGADSMETAVAKSVAVMQLLDDFPLTRHNLAALMVDNVGADPNETVISTAVDALQQDPAVPLEEIDGRLRFLSDRSAELQRDWRDIQPNSHEQRQTIADVLRDHILPQDPKTQIYGAKQIRGKPSLAVLGSQQTLRSAAGDVDVEIRLVPDSEFAAARKSANQDSLQPGATGQVLVVAGINKALFDTVRDAFACTKMQNRLRSQARDADEAEFLQSLDDRRRNAESAISDGIRVALEDGSVIHRGTDIAVHSQAASFDAALTTAIKAVAEDMYNHFPNAAVTPSTTAAEKLLKTKDHTTITSQDDPLDLLSGGTGAFQSAHPAVQDIRDYINRKGTVEGRALLDDFAGQPYGWNKDVTRYVVAAMFVASRISLRINGRPYTTVESAVTEAFKSNNSFAKVGLDAPPKPLDQEILKRAKEAVIELTGDTSIMPIPAKLEKAIRDALPQLAEQARTARSAASHLGLGVTGRLTDTVGEIQSLTGAAQETLLRAVADEDRTLVSQLVFMREIEGKLSGTLGQIIERLQGELDLINRLATGGNYRILRDEAAPFFDATEELLESTDPRGIQTELQKLEHQLTEMVAKYAAIERDDLIQRVATWAAQIEHKSEWKKLPPDVQERLRPTLQRLQSDGMPEHDDPYQWLKLLHQERISRITLFGELSETVDTEATKVVPPQPAGDSTSIALPAERLSQKSALERLTELVKAVDELDEDATVQFVIGEE